MTVDLTGHLKTCRRSHPHEEMDDVCERYTEYERELASLRAEKERAKAEVARLNQWADSFTDIHLKERQTGDALVKETMQRAERAEAERDAALKDAERYRFLCEGEYQDDGEMWTAISNTSIKDEWDAEIDAAIDAARKGEQ